tara:strand:- start:495 stop:902 length:408 start_codon:yes stop_codon:yes gene_type:complete
MKPNTITALKKVVQEMVQKEVAKQINIVVNEITNPTVSEADTANNYTNPKPESKQLAKDPVLNKILNETQGGIMGNDEYPTMGGKTYTSQDMNTLVAPQQIQVSDDTPDFMKKAMSGHSAKVVKAIESKHGTKAK